MWDLRKIQEEVIYRAVRDASDDITARKVVSGEQGNGSSEDNTVWVKNTMMRLESSFGQDSVIKIRMNCQCGYGMEEKLKLVRDLMGTVSSMEEFGNQLKAREAGLSCVNGELFLRFLFCPCPMLADVEKLDSYTWCQCTTGYSKVLFEQAFGCVVDVELIKSIKAGDEICLMKIIPEKPVWNKEKLVLAGD